MASARFSLLQWDRAFDSAEGMIDLPPDVSAATLQWDRAFDSAEGFTREQAEATVSALQWDRAFDSAEGPSAQALKAQPERCFNGTAHLMARKAEDDMVSHRPAFLLQWDRAFDSAEGGRSETCGVS